MTGTMVLVGLPRQVQVCSTRAFLGHMHEAATNQDASLLNPDCTQQGWALQACCGHASNTRKGTML